MRLNVFRFQVRNLKEYWLTTGASVSLVPKIQQASCLRFIIFAVKPGGLFYFASKPKA